MKLTLSYAGFLMLAGTLLLAVVWVFLLRYVPEKIHIQAVPQAERTGRPFPDAPRSLFVPNRSDLEEAFVPKATLALLFLLVFGVVGGWVLAGRMLQPLARITRATRLAAGGSLSHRISLEGPSDEFRELADAFDGMLEKLEAHVAEQRRFAANASHELRTPLSVTQTLLEVARKDPAKMDRELMQRLYTVNQRAIHLTEALLVLSQADQRSFTPEVVELSLIVEEASETLLPLAEKTGITLEVSGDVTPTLGSPLLLRQLVMNLMQNAIVHNLPGGGTVWVTTFLHSSGVMLTVENTGEVLSPEQVATLVEPFVRGSGRIHTDHAGVGLGLAIAHSITRAHDGRLSLTPRIAGGLHVMVQLPSHPHERDKPEKGLRP